MNKSDYIVLLRGINVGGNNIIKMSDLKLCFENSGFKNVTTYIQSGNVLLSSDENDKIILEIQIENLLSKAFNYNSKIVLLTTDELITIIQKAPVNFGSEPEIYKYDVAFLKENLVAADLIAKIKLKEGVDNAFSGNRVLYFSKLISKSSQSYLPKIINQDFYKEITIRNWNTTRKIFELTEKIFKQ